jgi:hypothetical protein
LSGILFFAVVFALAIGAVRRPEAHKRLMLLATISLLDAPVARWFLTFLAPPGPPGPPPRRSYDSSCLCRLSATRSRRHLRLAHTRTPPIHYVFGGAALVALKLLNLPLSATRSGIPLPAAYWRSLNSGSRFVASAMSLHGCTFPTCRGGLTMSAPEGRTDMQSLIGRI